MDWPSPKEPPTAVAVKSGAGSPGWSSVFMKGQASQRLGRDARRRGGAILKGLFGAIEGSGCDQKGRSPDFFSKKIKNSKRL